MRIISVCKRIIAKKSCGKSVFSKLVQFWGIRVKLMLLEISQEFRHKKKYSIHLYI